MKKTSILLILLTSIFSIFSVGFHPASEVLPGQFSSGDFTFDGNIGIGTSSPLLKLDVNGNSRIKGYLMINNTNSHLWLTGTTSDGGVQVVGDLLKIQNWNVGNNAINLELLTGNVGIGTSTPIDKLDIQDGSAIINSGKTGISRYITPGNNWGTINLWYNGSYNDVDATDGFPLSGGSIAFGGQYHSSGFGSNFAAIRGNKETVGTESNFGELTFWTVGATGIENRMTITSSGNIGIGTDTPSYPIHIKDATPYVKFEDIDDDSVWLVGGYSTYFRIVEDSTDRFTILSGGNVGIGTTSPVSKLDIRVTDDITSYGFNNLQNSLIINSLGNSVHSGGSISLGSSLGGYSKPTATIKAGATNSNAGYLLLATASSVGSMPSTKMIITAGGNVGIGDTTPSYKLDVNGNFRAFGITDSSDIRLKENIETINYGLDEVLQLQPVKYNWINRNISNETQLGFIAQDVEELIPELVATADDGYKSMYYNKINTLLVNAIKEQQTQIEELNEKNLYLENKINELGEKLK